MSYSIPSQGVPALDSKPGITSVLNEVPKLPKNKNSSTVNLPDSKTNHPTSKATDVNFQDLSEALNSFTVDKGKKTSANSDN